MIFLYLSVSVPKDLSNSYTAAIAPSVDIVPSIRSLDLSPSPNPSNRKTGSTKTKTKTTDSQPKPKPKPQHSKTYPINVPKGPSGSQSSKSQPPKPQAEHPTVCTGYTPLAPPSTIIDRAEGGKTYQFQARAKPGAVRASPKKIRRSPQNRTTRSNSALIATQAPLSTQPLSSPVPPKRQASSSLQELTKKVPQQTFKYVVQASGGLESSKAIVGVYSKLEKANEYVKRYVKRCTARARRRSWQGKMSEIRVGGAWVKVLPKEFIASKGGDREMYLAVNKSGSM
ncbi:hypothetical protein DL98DRAFT_541836 [Cadophora sp. DSE1049]|nr:hypothetical protein DL98DRAFT_541836 [Cadophora sp. DSE1049]